MKIIALQRAARIGLVFSLVLGGCVSNQIGGPTAPEDAPDAGTLTLPSGRSFPVYPRELAFTGEAAYRWPDGRTYEGQFIAGVPEGIGTGTWPDGDRYRGTWHLGRQHGHGELTRANGSHYLGDFVDGHRAGHGAEQSEEGLYRGEWHNDLPNGQGNFNATDGASYSGQWQDGYRQGYGSYTDTRGNRYEGDWNGDVPDGFGTMHSVDDSVYEGEWRISQRTGYGKLTTDVGVVYEGTWQEDERQGFGIAVRPDGSRYEGNWVAGRREGQGRESYPDGSYHDGIWRADQPAGPGTRKDRTGILISGRWDGDRLSDASMRLPSGAEYSGRLLISRNTAVDAGLLAWLEDRAGQDDPWAHFFLGTAYVDFSQPVPDLFKATGHFRRAARAGIPDGQFRLALLLVDKSPARAIEWLEKAAEANQAQANTLLGEYYLTGRWVQEDLPAAIRYLRAGSDAGDLAARNNLAWILATTAQPGLRDGEESLALIRPLALLHGGWQHFDTLAAAYAATGDYREATRALERAVQEASRTLGDTSPEVAAMRDRLDHYQAEDPLRKK